MSKKNSNELLLYSLFVIAASFILLSFTSCREGESPSGPLNPYKRYKEFTNVFNIKYSYRNSLNNHFPFGISDIRGPFIWDSLWAANQINFLQYQPSTDSTYEVNLDVNNLETFKDYIRAVLQGNGVQQVEFTSIYSFGIKKANNTTNDVFGFAFRFWYSQYGTQTLDNFPGLAFTQVQAIDVKYSQYQEIERKYAKTYTTAHEISHARGFTSLGGTLDHVHNCHYKWNEDVYSYCLMSDNQGHFINNYTNYFPLHFCERHRRIFADSLKNYIQTGLFFGQYCLF